MGKGGKEKKREGCLQEGNGVGRMDVEEFGGTEPERVIVSQGLEKSCRTNKGIIAYAYCSSMNYLEVLQKEGYAQGGWEVEDCS